MRLKEGIHDRGRAIWVWGGGGLSRRWGEIELMYEGSQQRGWQIKKEMESRIATDLLMVNMDDLKRRRKLKPCRGFPNLVVCGLLSRHCLVDKAERDSLLRQPCLCLFQFPFGFPAQLKPKSLGSHKDSTLGCEVLFPLSPPSTSFTWSRFHNSTCAMKLSVQICGHLCASERFNRISLVLKLIKVI